MTSAAAGPASTAVARHAFHEAGQAFLVYQLPTGSILEANPSAHRLTGYSAGELRQRRLADLFSFPPQPDRPGDWWAQARPSLSGTLCAVGGQTLRVRGRASVIPDTGEALGLLIVEPAEEERQAGPLREEEKLESLGVLAGGIAHDFNNLLTTILGHASLAEEELPRSSPAHANLGPIQEAARRAAELCQQLLAYAGKGRFLVEAVNLNTIVRETVLLLGPSTSGQVALTLRLADHLPAVHADPAQMRQAVTALLNNALEALTAAGGQVTLTTALVHATRADLATLHLGADLPEGDYVCFEVRDTGCGMDDIVLARIFEPFFTTKFIGRGLGLSAVLGIVRGHQGALKVESAPGQGTTFTLLLPRSTEEAETADTLPPPAGTILLAEDEAGVRLSTAAILEQAGYEVVQAADGRQALEEFVRLGERVRLVLLDLTMPHGGGEQALEALKQRDANVRVLLMSGHSEAELEDRFAGKGLAGLLQKPFSKAELLQKVHEALEEGLGKS